MKIKTIICQKTKTIEVSGLLGRDTYRKIMWGAEAELESGEDEIAAKEALNSFVDMAIADEAKAMSEEATAKKKLLRLN